MRPSAPSVLAAVLAALTLAAPADAAAPAVSGGAAQARTGTAAGGVAAAAGTSSRRLLWATVNQCDTPSAPNTMGVRASMPGNGLRQRMYMRFTAQSWSSAKGGWTKVTGKGVSPWLYAGSARYRSRQAGWTFRFRAPQAGTGFTLRARVDFQWRARRKSRARRSPRRRRKARWVVLKRRRAYTRADLRGVDLGDPPGTSKAACIVL